MHGLQYHGEGFLVRGGPSRLSGGKLEPLATGVQPSLCDYAQLIVSVDLCRCGIAKRFFAAGLTYWTEVPVSREVLIAGWLLNEVFTMWSG
jgi:hypothetical protein